MAVKLTNKDRLSIITHIVVRYTVVAALLLTVFLLCICVNAAFEKINTYSDNFSDVKDTAWYADNVKIAYELGFMNGKSDSKFDPDGNVTVAEGIAMASRVHASLGGKDADSYTKKVDEIRIDFDT